MRIDVAAEEGIRSDRIRFTRPSMPLKICTKRRDEDTKMVSTSCGTLDNWIKVYNDGD